MIDVLAAHHHGLAASVLASVVLVVLSCLIKLNIQLGTTEPHFKKLVPEPWNRKQIRETYDRLVQNPITTASYASQLPPKLDRRYIVTGGSGLLGGYIVLQLLERGQPPNTIRIVDFQAPHRTDMLTGPATKVEFRKTDISSAESTQAAFRAPWDESVSKLPLTVFHTAAVIIPSARSELVNGFCESVNVHGTENVLVEARKAGADVLISTSSASIAIRPVEMWNKPWRLNDYPRYYSQVLDEADFFQPLRPHRQFFGNYPASKAKAERIVCGANKQELRTGSIRPANGVYGYPTDNLLGGPLTMQIYPEWVDHIVQSFIHGINCAVAHLQFESILADPASFSSPQAGRPFCVTDPSPPIYWGDLYNVLSTLAITPFRVVHIPPVPMLLLSYAIEFYNLLPARLPVLARSLPRLPGGLVYLEPGLFSICTHLVGNMSDACKAVEQGGLGYQGVVTTLEGMCQELLEWNREQEEHAREATRLAGTNGTAKVNARAETKAFRSSMSLAEEIQKLGAVGQTVKA